MQGIRASLRFTFTFKILHLLFYIFTPRPTPFTTHTAP